MKKRNIIIIIIIALIIVIVAFIIFRNVQLGYNKISMIYDKEEGSQTIELGVPKLSFMKKENDKSYSYKNIRSNKVLNNEVKSYLNTMEKIECNDTTYYYDSKNDFTIINFSINDHILYNTISYEVRYGNYCFNLQMDKYSKKMGGIKRYHTLNDEAIKLSEDTEFIPRLVVGFLDDVDLDSRTFTASLYAYYLTPISNNWESLKRKELEKSSGIYEIKGDKLYYTRTSIEQKSDDIDIPETSIFEIKDKKLVLLDNYLSKYDNNVILK